MMFIGPQGSVKPMWQPVPWALSEQVAPGYTGLLVPLDASLQTEACQSVSLFSFIARVDSPGGDAVYPVPAEPKECGGPAVRARI